MNYTKTKDFDCFLGRSMALDKEEGLYFLRETNNNGFSLVKIDINMLEYIWQSKIINGQQIIGIHDQKIVTHDLNGVVYLYNIENGRFLNNIRVLSNSVIGSIKNGIINGIKYTDSLKLPILWDITKNKEVWASRSEGEIIFFDQNSVLIQEWEIKRANYKLYFDYLNLSAYDVNENKVKWSIDLTKFGNFDRFNTIPRSHLRDFIMVAENTFILRINPYGLVAIDLHPGKIIWHNTILNNYLTASKHSDSQINRLIYSKKEQKIVKLNFANLYLEFDIQQQVVSRVIDKMDLNFNFWGAQFMKNKDFILFIGGQDGSSNTFGIFSRKLLKVIWSYNLEAGISTMPLIKKDKIIVKDNQEILHIFERTD